MGLFALLLLVFSDAASAAETLRWKFQKGATYDYVLERRVNAKFDVAGNKIQFGFRLILDLLWQVTNVHEDGGAEISQTVNRIQVLMSAPDGGELRYDSKQEEPKESPLWKQVGPRLVAMLGETFTLTVAASGTVEEFTLPKKLADELTKESEAGGQRMAGMSGFSAENMKALVEKSFFELPAVLVNQGDNWSQRIETKMGAIGTQATDLKYTYQGSRKKNGQDLCKIDAVSLVTFVPSPDAPDVELELNEQEGSGSISFDLAAGRTRESSFAQRLKMTIVARGNEVVQELKEGLILREGKSPEAGSLDKEDSLDEDGVKK